MVRALLLIALLFASSTLAAQSTPPSPAPTDREVTAVFAENAPRIDGHIDEALWAGIDPVQTFIQVWPETGSEATERTEVRIAYDRDYLYFAFQNFDDNPELIRAKNLERGGRNDRDDHVYIGLDTYQDGRNAYLFEMNALGTQDDATITDEGLTIDSFSWDAVFRSETVIDETGWSMEVSIPFRQLRFPEGDDLSFGLMLSRTINRKNERVMWPEIGLERGSSFAALATVSQYGVLKGLKNVRRGRNLEIKPYAITGAQENRQDPLLEPAEGEFTYDAGIDIKYGITSNLTLDLSVNTDFAQVEADNVQLNLSRFSLFFPEKREFFLERSGLFEHGNPRSTQTFFSRRIGLADQILAGARVTGQAGPISVGALNIATGPGAERFPRIANGKQHRCPSTCGRAPANNCRRHRHQSADGLDLQPCAGPRWADPLWREQPRRSVGDAGVGLRREPKQRSGPRPRAAPDRHVWRQCLAHQCRLDLRPCARVCAASRHAARQRAGPLSTARVARVASVRAARLGGGRWHIHRRPER